MAGRPDAFLEIDRGAPLLVHDADLERVAGKAERVLGAVEQLVGEGDFLGPVHLGLDDVDRAGAAVPEAGIALDVVHGDERGHDAIEDALGHGLVVAIEDGGVHHQVADVAHQQQAAAVQGYLSAAVGRGVDAIGVEPARHVLAAPSGTCR